MALLDDVCCPWFCVHNLLSVDCMKITILIALALNIGIGCILYQESRVWVKHQSIYTLQYNTIQYTNINYCFKFRVELYADDTLIYSCVSTVSQSYIKLQSDFNIVQSQLHDLKLGLNADKSKLTWCSVGLVVFCL